MIPAIGSGKELSRLLELYSRAVRQYSSANDLMIRAIGKSDLYEAAEQVADEAKANCEAAREALMKHREEHGCG